LPAAVIFFIAIVWHGNKPLRGRLPAE